MTTRLTRASAVPRVQGVIETGIFSTGNLAGKTGASPTERLNALVLLARRAENAGFDVFAAGEAHTPPAVISSPLIVLSHIAGVTSGIKLSTAVSLITVNDPVKLAEDISTLEHLIGDRLGVMLGRGVNQDIYHWYGLDPTETVAIAEERYELFRRLWTEEKVDWEGRFRVPLDNFTLTPRPRALPEVWHTSIRTKELVEQTARYGEGFFANYVHFSAEQGAPHVRLFRERYEVYGHGPAETAPVGSGAKVYVKPRSQDALREFQEQGYDISKWKYHSLDEALRLSALTVGSPNQVLDKISHFQEMYGGYQRQFFSIDQPCGTIDQMLEQVDLIGEHVLPELRRAYDFV